ncbi:MAG: 3-ketoacyl-ACP reductase [Roseibium sp.]|uniref:3-ketoacyl-ACP reductase n=1 Tax=Roseibium sp. TaxID=1936156 RepID=UPI001B160547|nr:3-ketoacyl-ACP reductase [Roseibium sp.]MBO6895511.1 3-ketoacyl-ACP reductase [Roseibium sp.]MBO6932815.1 3-ketoacyl-ACP reductase [Roseibium sp.]
MSKIALVTGGQKGIGLGIAEALVGAGYKVALVSRSKNDAPDVAEALRKLGSAASYFSHDIQDVDGHAALMDRVEAEVGPVTTFVSNAGVPAKVRGDMLDIVPENFDFVLNVNLRGAFFLAQEAARRMINMSTDTYRSIAFVTSVSAEMVSIERAEYCISKAGAAMMAELFAVRLAPHGIGVFELRPGIIETGMTAGVKDKYTVRIENGLVPAARWGQPEDIGSTVVPIAEGHLAFATGTVIDLDGGLSIPRL